MALEVLALAYDVVLLAKNHDQLKRQLKDLKKNMKCL
jgi:hypothetical protein